MFSEQAQRSGRAVAGFGIDAPATGPDNRRMPSFATASVNVRRLPLFMRWRVVASVAGGKLKQSM
jgi:hypothetical protein